jgi:hypothetical protein
MSTLQRFGKKTPEKLVGYQVQYDAHEHFLASTRRATSVNASVSRSILLQTIASSRPVPRAVQNRQQKIDNRQ